MNRTTLMILTLSLLLLAACQQSLLGSITYNETNESGESPYASEEELLLPAENETAEPEPAGHTDTNGHYTLTKTEGDLVLLAPEAYDPDGDTTRFTYEEPFDEQGRWQTTYGDAGEYLITVTVTDTKGASSSEVVRVVILPANRPPFLKCPESIVVKEGERVTIDCEANDAEGESVRLTYLGWMVDKSYQTTYADAGSHEVIVKANDESGLSTEKSLTIIVQDVNRPPVFPLDYPARIEAEEGDVIALDTSGVYDPDGDAVTFTFSDPFGADGVWKSERGDAGTYPAEIVASDGTNSVKQELIVELAMVNTAPVLKRIPDITVEEGDTITLALEATDREGDDLSYSITGWFESQRYTTTYEDAGSYSVKVTVSDGEFSDSQVVHITVLDKNRPPYFTVPA